MSPGETAAPPRSPSEAMSRLTAWLDKIEGRFDQVELRLGDLAAEVHRLKQEVFSPRPSPVDLPLSAQMWDVLRYLSRQGNVTVSTLAKHCTGVRGGHDRRAVKNLLDQLEGWGLVGSSQKDQGRRWHLTGDGFHRVKNHAPSA